MTNFPNYLKKVQCIQQIEILLKFQIIPNGAFINAGLYKELKEVPKEGEDVTLLQSRRDIAYAVQTQTQEKVTELIRKQ